MNQPVKTNLPLLAADSGHPDLLPFCHSPDVLQKSSSITLWLNCSTAGYCFFSHLIKAALWNTHPHIWYTIHHTAVGGMLCWRGDEPWQQANTTVCRYGNLWTGEREERRRCQKLRVENEGREMLHNKQWLWQHVRENPPSGWVHKLTIKKIKWEKQAGNASGTHSVFVQ